MQIHVLLHSFRETSHVYECSVFLYFIHIVSERDVESNAELLRLETALSVRAYNKRLKTWNNDLWKKDIGDKQVCIMLSKSTTTDNLLHFVFTGY